MAPFNLYSGYIYYPSIARYLKYLLKNIAISVTSKSGKKAYANSRASGKSKAESAKIAHFVGSEEMMCDFIGEYAEDILEMVNKYFKEAQ